MNKNLFVITGLILLLSSCFGGEPKSDAGAVKSEEQAGLAFHSSSDFSLNVPAAWESLSSNSGNTPKPSHGNLELALASTKNQEGISNNLVVLSQELEKSLTSTEYAISNHLASKREYFSYVSVNFKEFTSQGGEKTMLYNFYAKYSEHTPRMQFVQTSFICERSKAYVLTLAIPTSIKDVTKYENIFASFSCK